MSTFLYYMVSVMYMCKTDLNKYCSEEENKYLDVYFQKCKAPNATKKISYAGVN